ncbi:MAG: hypothetical protein ACT4P2_15690 [Pseudomonadota bacterium]
MLTEFQRRVLACIARNRSPDSLVAGGAALNRKRARLSCHVDIFHEAVARVQAAARQDLGVLRQAEFRTETVPGFSRGHVQAIVRDGNGVEFTRLEWTVESAFRFFPAVEDPEFGWRLHDIDLAVNKVLALAGRQEPRDVVDVVELHAHGYPLAALAWAAPAKDAGFTPDLVLDEISRNSRLDPARLTGEILTSAKVDAVAMKKTLLAAIREARKLFPNLPPDHMGCLYLDADSNVAMPNPEAVAAQRLHLHGARLRGAWPAIPDRPG